MTVLDQFELYSRTETSGGLNSYVYFGTMFSTGNASQYFRRRGLFDKFARPTSIENVATTMSGVDYGEIIQRASGSGYRDMNHMFQKYTTSDEYYYDSVLPHPWYYCYFTAVSQSSEGTGTILTTTGNTAPIWRETVFEPTNNLFFAGTRTLKTVLTSSFQARAFLSPGRGYTSNRWNAKGYPYTWVVGAGETFVANFLAMHTFPLERYYRSLERNIAKTTTIKHRPTDNQTNFKQLTWDNTTKQLVFGTKPGFPTATVAGASLTYELSLAYALTSSAVFGTYNYDNGVSTVTTANSGVFILREHKTLLESSASNPSLELMQRYLFGFGDGPFDMCLPRRMEKFPNVGAVGHDPITITNNLNVFYALGIRQRGWKYGVYHGSPQSTQIIFRRNRFGQFRDILEQRPYSKFFDGTNPLQPAVSISFNTGSQDYLTASNPGLNVFELGYYSFESTVARPFSDSDTR